MPKKFLTVTIDEDIADEVAEQLRNFIQDFYEEDAGKIEISGLADAADWRKQ